MVSRLNRRRRPPVGWGALLALFLLLGTGLPLYAQETPEEAANTLFIPALVVPNADGESQSAELDPAVPDQLLAAAAVSGYQVPCGPGTRAGLTTWHSNGSFNRFAYDFRCMSMANGTSHVRNVYAPVNGTVEYSRNYGGATRHLIKIYDAVNNVCVNLFHLESRTVSVTSPRTQVTRGQKIGVYSSADAHVHMSVMSGNCSVYDTAREVGVLFRELGYVPSQRIDIDGIRDNSSVPQPYSARLWMVTGTTGSGTDMYEADDSYQTADPIAANGVGQARTFQKAGANHTVGDQDWLKFSTSGGRTYAIETYGLTNGADTYLGLFNTDGRSVLATNDNGGGGRMARIVWRAPQSATYYIKVRDVSSTREGAGYAIRIKLIPLQDGFEPDDIYTQAKTIGTTGSRQVHTIHRAGDQDWMKFSATSGRTYVIETLNLRDGADTVLGLFNTNGGDLIDRSDDAAGLGRASRIVWTAARSGTYYLKVRDYSNSRYNVGYDIRVYVSGSRSAQIAEAVPETSILADEPVVAEGVASLRLEGMSLQGSSPLTVTLYGTPLPVDRQDDGRIRVVLPNTLPAGTHALEVSDGTAQSVVLVTLAAATYPPEFVLPLLTQTQVQVAAPVDGGEVGTAPDWSVAVQAPAAPVLDVTLYGEVVAWEAVPETGLLWITLPASTKSSVQTLVVWGAAGPLGVVELAGTGVQLYLPSLSR